MREMSVANGSLADWAAAIAAFFSAMAAFASVRSTRARLRPHLDVVCPRKFQAERRQECVLNLRWEQYTFGVEGIRNQGPGTALDARLWYRITDVWPPHERTIHFADIVLPMTEVDVPERINIGTDKEGKFSDVFLRVYLTCVDLDGRIHESSRQMWIDPDGYVHIFERSYVVRSKWWHYRRRQLAHWLESKYRHHVLPWLMASKDS